MATIKKAKLTKGRTLEITLEEYAEVGGNMATNEVVKKCGYLAHADLISAFTDIVPHMMNICEMHGNAGDFNVTGFVLSQSEKTNAVMFMGNKTLSTGKVLNLNTPLQDMFGSEYPMVDELNKVVETALSEVEQYLDGKCAVKQSTIEFDEDDLNAEIKISDDKPKKQGRKKKTEIEKAVDNFHEFAAQNDVTVEVKTA